MKILKYKKEKGNQYECIFEDGSTHLLYDDIIVQHNLLLKSDILSEELEALLQQNNALSSYYLAIHYLQTKMRSKKEMEKYLLQKGFETGNVKKTISKLEKDGYLSEEIYIKAYLHDCLQFSLDGPNKIKKKLKDLGLKETLISTHINAIEKNFWKERMKKIVEKKIRSNHRFPESVFKQRMQSYLYMQGYELNQILSSLETVKITLDQSILQAEYNKIKKKLERKYEGQELDYRVNQRLLQKGFTKPEINQLNIR